MYYDSRKKKKGKIQSKGKSRGKGRRSKRRGLLGFLFRFLFFVLLILALIAGALYVYPVEWFAKGGSGLLAANDLPNGLTHVLLLGIDRDANGTSRADSILVASVGSGTVKLTSILRDTKVSIPGHGEGKINAAYAYGGATLMMQTVNSAFSLNISKYAVVDYESFPVLVDVVGGVTVNVTEAELVELNHNVGSLWQTFAARGVTVEPLEQTGDVLLNGYRALGYARIRKIGNDYERTSRQREVLSALFAKVKQNLWTLPNLAMSLLSEMETNLNPVELLSLGMKAVFADGIGQLRLPATGLFTESGSYLVPDLPKNQIRLREFLYSEDAK